MPGPESQCSNSKLLVLSKTSCVLFAFIYVNDMHEEAEALDSSIHVLLICNP